MEFYPEEIWIDSHSHSKLKKKPAKKPYNCGGCKESEFDLKSCYQCLKCEFHLHIECVPSTHPFWLELIRCDLKFELDPRGKIIACDACGKMVRGSFYQGVSRGSGKARYLHPCCAKLPFKRTDNGGVALDLKEKTSLACLICGDQGHSRDFKSWVYVPRSGKYCYHVACVKGRVEKWKTEEGRNQQPRNDVGTSSRDSTMTLRRPAQRPAGWEFDFSAAVEILNFVVSLLFGIPPLPFALVISWLKWKK